MCWPSLKKWSVFLTIATRNGGKRKTWQKTASDVGRFSKSKSKRITNKNVWNCILDIQPARHVFIAVSLIWQWPFSFFAKSFQNFSLNCKYLFYSSFPPSMCKIILFYIMYLFIVFSVYNSDVHIVNQKN